MTEPKVIRFALAACSLVLVLALGISAIAEARSAPAEKVSPAQTSSSTAYAARSCKMVYTKYWTYQNVRTYSDSTYRYARALILWVHKKKPGFAQLFGFKSGSIGKFRGKPFDCMHGYLAMFDETKTECSTTRWAHTISWTPHSRD